MVQVPRYIGPMTIWYYNLRNTMTSLRLFIPGVDFIFIFYHPCGHDRGREDRFNVKNTNGGYGGAHRETHPENIKK